MPLKQKQFKVASWGATLQGQLWLPDTPGKYPAVVYFHGLGANNPAIFLTEGPLKPVAADGWKAPYVIFGIAGQSSYPPDPGLMKYALENDPEIKQYWDGVNVLWTGLSQGGFSTLLCASEGYTGAFVPMSSPAFNPNLLDGNKTYRAWAFHADNDGICPLQNVKPAYDKMKAKFTLTHDGHSNWNKYYDPNYKEDGKNLYEFAFDTSAVTPTKKVVLTYILNNGKKLVVYDNDSYEEIV